MAKGNLFRDTDMVPLFLLALLDGSLSGNKVEINFLEERMKKLIHRN